MVMHQKTRVLSAKKVREISQNNNINTGIENKTKYSIRGFCRIRKLLPNEISINPVECLKQLDSTTLNILDYSEISGGKTSKGQTFNFHGVFDKDANNEKLYSEMFKGIVSPVLESVKDFCFICKGVTNSGKTFSMIGEGEKDPGMLVRCLNELFFMRDKKEIGSIKISMTYVEIYNEIIRDLLDDGKSKNTNINVKEDLNRGTILENVNEVDVTSLKDAYKLILKGNSNRMSESKSQTISKEHINSILTIHINNNIQNKQSGNFDSKYSKFVFVELAGSETLMTNKKGDKNSSKSIVCLFRCLEMMNELSIGSSNVKKLFPWREAILSRILRDIFEKGRSSIVMLTNVSPSVMTLEQTQYAIKCAIKVIHIQQKVSKQSSNPNDEKSFVYYDEELTKKKNELENLKEELAKIIHSQHITNPQSSTQYGNKIQNILTDIHAHFSQELALQAELLNEMHKEFLLTNEVSIKEYEVFKIQHDSDNIVNKDKGLTLKIKDYSKDVSKINEKLIHTKARIQDKYQVLSDFKKRREELEGKISLVLNEPLGSSLNVAYKSYVLAYDKYEKELSNKFGNFEVKKHDWELYKLISQIKIRDKTIENMLLELNKLDVKNLDITKEKDSLRLIQDYRIDQNAIFQFANSGKVNYQPVNELLNSIDSRSNKPKMVSFKSSNSSLTNNKKYENNDESINSSFKNHPNSVKSDHIKFNQSDTNSNNPYMVNVPMKKDYNRNNKLSVNYVKEVTPNMYDYSDYKNPFINKKKIKFNTKTTKVIEANLRGGLNEVKMRVLDSLYPNSKVDFLYDNRRSNNLNVSKDKSIINKMNITSHSNRSNSDSKHNSLMNKSQGSFDSYEERKIERKVKKIYPNKGVVGRYQNNPYVNSKN